jgi:arylsulfatase A-like enzyme/Flp pilus assembly protein TadD
VPVGVLTTLTLALAVAIGAWWYVHRATTGGGARRPNVLLVTIDTLRADHVGAYGASTAHTPALDRLAAEGLRCTDAIAAAPITMPSHASLLTGLYPSAHGVHDNGTAALPRDVVTLADRLSSAGYSTHAFVSAVVLSRLYGLDKGFATYDDDLWSEDAPRLFMIRERTARRTADRFVEWFGQWSADQRRSGDRARTAAQGPASASPAPFFTWVHFFDPHQPHEAAPEDRQGAASPYDAEVTAADRGVGRLIETLRGAGALDDTIVIVTSDHGESLGEHGEATHAIFVYDATVRVPLIVRYPRAFPAGKVYEGPVRHIDVVPTLLAMLGLPGGAETQGVDLTAPWQGKAPAPELSQYSESLLSELGFGMAPLHALRKNGFKWIRAPRPELYDLKADARELTNLHPAQADRSAAMDAELDAIMRAAKPHPDQAKDGGPMARETMEMLQSLGYLAPGTVRQSMSGIDPKDGIQIYNQLEEARHRAQERKWKEAEAIVRQILAKLPNHVAAQNVLGLSLVRQRRYPEAREAYAQSLAADPTQFRVHANLGSLALFQHDLDGAEQGFKKALELNPRFIEAMLNLGLVSSLRGDNAGAEAWYRKADGVDPNFPATARRLGDLYYEQGQFAQALASYEHALQLSPKLFPAMVQAGNSARRVGDPAKAAASFTRAAQLRPDSWVPWYNLACLRATTGDADGALTALRESVTRGVADPTLLDTDPDLAPLRADPRFGALARDARGR